MRRVILRFVLGLAFFLIMNIVSDTVGVGGIDDSNAVYFYGFPFSYRQDTGSPAFDCFSCAALWADIVAAVVVSASLALCYRSIRYDVLRTIGFDA